LLVPAKLRPEYRLPERVNVFSDVRSDELHVFIGCIISLEPSQSAVQEAAHCSRLKQAGLVYRSLPCKSYDESLNPIRYSFQQSLRAYSK
jgi:hypothetical protein